MKTLNQTPNQIDLSQIQVRYFREHELIIGTRSIQICQLKVYHTSNDLAEIVNNFYATFRCRETETVLKKICKILGL